MREVIAGRVWIGNARDARDVSVVLEKEIQAVVDLAMEEPPVHYPREIIYCRFPLIDGGGNSPGLLKTTIQTLVSLIQTETQTLVACSGGMSRSPAVTAVALSIAKGGASDAWLKQIAAIGPHDVSSSLWNEMLQVAEST